MELPNLSNKKLDNLSLEDLLTALENSPQHTEESLKLPDDTPPVIEFIQRFKLESGEYPVESRLLWNLYLQYYPLTITREVFSEHANKLLSYDKAFFYLNKPAKELYSLLLKKLPDKREYRKPKRDTKPKAHFITFFQEQNIVAGEHKIPWFALFHLYRCYAVDKSIKRPVSKQVFLAHTKLFLRTVQASFGSVFLVDKVTSLKVPKSDYPKLQKLYEKEFHTTR